MSQTLLEFQFEVSGVLTAATSVLLSDPTGTYGVRRTDNDDTVVADGTAMTAVSTGVYRYTVTDPAPDLVYEWHAEVLYNAQTYRFSYTAQGGADDVTGDYATKSGIRLYYGTVNADTYSNRAGGSTADDATYQHFINAADAMINREWSDAGETTTPIASDDDRYDRMTFIADRWAGAQMYLSRGMYDDVAGGANLQGMMSGHVKEAERELSAIIRLWRKAGTAPTAGVSNAYRRTRHWEYLASLPSGLPDGLD